MDRELQRLAMAEAALVRRGEGATIHGKGSRRTGEHQGVRGELTGERLVEEEHWVKLSTCEVVGGDGSFMEGAEEHRRSSAKRQNGFGEVHRSLQRGELRNGRLVRPNCSKSSAMAGKLSSRRAGVQMD